MSPDDAAAEQIVQPADEADTVALLRELHLRMVGAVISGGGLARLAELAQARGWDPTIRLACQTSASGDVTLERIVLSEATASQLQAETVGREAGAERQLAILFCDMRDFTALADSNSAFDVVHILNRFFEALGDPILLNGGIISHYTVGPRHTKS